MGWLPLPLLVTLLVLVGDATGLDNVRGTYTLVNAKGGACAPKLSITDRGPELKNDEILFNGVACTEGKVRLNEVQNGLGDASMLEGEVMETLKCANDMRFLNFHIVQPAKDVKSPVPTDGNKLTYRAGVQYLALWSDDSTCVFTTSARAINTDATKKDIAPAPPQPQPRQANKNSASMPKPPVLKPDAKVDTNGKEAPASNEEKIDTTTNSGNSNATNGTLQGAPDTATTSGTTSTQGKGEVKAPSLSGEGTAPSNTNRGASSGNRETSTNGIGSIGETATTTSGARGRVSAAAPWYWLGPLLAVFAILLAVLIAFCARSHGLGKPSPPPPSTAYMSESGRADYIRPVSMESAHGDPNLVPISPMGAGDLGSQYAAGSPLSPSTPVLYHFPDVVPAPPVAPTPPSYPHHPTGHQWVDDR